ncbi:MAG: MtrB/PioB family outer membrane beta-barrel protein, partial [Phycisphaerales bacterium]|nr:MtrB/PioB family outer membrane beta-barrel protein [Phycisphaerales bacterium]
LDFRGGKYGAFKYQLYDTELRHNFGSGFGARSPYAGIGGTTLTAGFPNVTPTAWNTFDHSYSRRDLGGMFEVSANTPWYFRAEANEVKRQGINVIAGAQGTSPGNGNMDLPIPIDYTTMNYSAEGGYASKRGHFAVNYMQSRFSNDNALLRWTNGFLGGVDTTILAPSNDLTRISANGNLRKLPGDSTLAGRVTHSKLTNSVAVQSTMLSTGGTTPATAASSPVFNGDIKYTPVSLSLSSHPLHDLDTRLYWNWALEKNDSTQVIFRPAVASGLLGGASSNCSTTGPAACVPELFGYKKNNYGIEAGYRFNRANRITGAFDYYDISRDRFDFRGNV